MLDEQLAWWRQQLADVAPLQLPIDKPRPPVQTFRGAFVPVLLPSPLAQALKALCQREAVTPFMLLLACWQALLARYCGQHDVSIGSPIAGRQRAETEGLIGFFVNTLVLRSRVEGTTSLRQLLQQVKETALGAYAHQDVPFERLVEELRPERDMSRSPLFQVVFALQNTAAAVPSQQLPGLTLRPVEVELNATKFELELGLTETAQGFSGSLGYNTDLFEASTARRIAEHFRVLTDALVTRPEAPLASVSMLTQAERQQVLVEWSTNRATPPRESTLPEVFAQVVARFPDKVAVEFDGAKLTYWQLDERANQLAHHLRGLGVSADARVALAVERSLELIVSLVAILKAGGAYVPIDPGYPRERLAAMVEDASPRVLVTSRALLSKLPTEGLATVVLEDTALSALPTHAPSMDALPDGLAYIDFTSGSTGRPKGVGTTHRGVLRTLLGVDYARFGPEEVLLHFAPISFDASTFEIWGALLHGARLVVMPPQVPSLEELGHVLQSSGVTTLWATIGLFTQLVDNPPPGLTSVKHVMTGGDVVSPAHVRRAVGELRIPVSAFYGPTETTVFATSHPVTHPEQVGPSVPIGRPISGTRLYVLDSHGQPTPEGVIGELFIGGDGVARGYVGQPSLTAERFVPDPFSGVPGARLYRTGDWVRWRGDGVLDFVGRADAQVKVRGYRIELAEVEAALRALPEVREAVAVVREDRPGDKRLVGYVVVPESVDVGTLRADLKQRLPEYMVPSALVRLEALPLTANAKVDRKALPAPEASSARAEYVAPRTRLEEQIAQVFAEVLNVERVGLEDDFFALGGHSLLAVRLMALIRERTGLTLRLASLFQGSTVERLAALARTQQAGRSRGPNLARLDSGTSQRRPLFLVHGGGGALLSYAELVQHLGDERPIQGIFAPGMDGGELPPASMEALARLYVRQVRDKQPHGPYLLAGWSLGGLVAYEMARQLQAQGEQVGLLALIDSYAPSGQVHPVPPPLERLASFGRMLGLPLQELPPLELEQLSGLEGPELVERVMEGLRNLPAAGALEPAQAGRLFAVHQQLTAAHHGYVPRGAYTGTAELLLASVPPAFPVTPDRGWSAWVSEGVKVSVVPGDHLTLLQPPNVATLAEKLKELLRASDEE